MNTPSIGQTLDELARQAAAGSVEEAAGAEEGATAAEGGEGTVPDGAEGGEGEGVQAEEAPPTPKPTAAPPAFDAASLPPELRGRSPQEIGELWGLMRQALSAAAANRAAGEVETPEVTPPEPEALKDLILEDPQKALDIMLQRNYGPLIRNLSTAAQEGLFASMRETYPDFKEYEPNVRKIIQSLNIPPEGVTTDAISAAYYMARGIAPATDRRARTKAATSAAALTEAPSPPAKKTTPASLDDTEREIARRTGMSEQEFVSWRDRGEAPLEMSVPTKVKEYGKVEPPKEKKD